MNASPRTVLVDGSALVYRAFYALPGNLATSAGLHTNAIYGFATMFRKMLAGRRPELGAVVFDAPGPTFRSERYPQYKANRPRMPQDLRQQLAPIDRLVAVHNFPLLRIPGYEADDVIGTLARRASSRGAEVLIVSSDKDFAQLISPQVRMVDTVRDVTYDEELVRKKWGVEPDRFVDLLALLGDKIDNIPGVQGIGRKGAIALLERYESLEAMLERVEELPGRQRKALAAQREQALLSRDLARIDCDVPLDLDLDDLHLTPPDPAALNALYRELEFFSLLTQEEADATAAALDGGAAVVASPAALHDILERIASAPPEAPPMLLPIVDAASSGSSGRAASSGSSERAASSGSSATAALAGLCVALDQAAHYIPLFGAGGLGTAGLDALRSWLEDPAAPKVTYESKRSWIVLRRAGITLRGVAGDLRLESFLVDPTKLAPHRLEQIARHYLQLALPPAKQIVGSGASVCLFSDVDADRLAAWACQRAVAAHRAWPLIRCRLEEEEQLEHLRAVDLPLAEVLGRMELDGIAVDRADLERMGEEFRRRLGDYEERIFELAGSRFNIGSTKQLSKVLFEDLGLPVIKRTKSGYSTDAEVLDRLAAKHEIARQVVEHRRLAKLINTYTDVLSSAVHPQTGRIHACYQQTVSATGRIISTDPDLQRTPVRTSEGKRIRYAFVAGGGCRLISADWSQIELRLLAHFSTDPLLVEAFRVGLDVHSHTASQIFDCALGEVTAEQRATGKLVNFATIYGQGATALGQRLGIPRKQAQRTIEEYFAAYRGVRSWLDRTMESAHEQGYVTTLLGRRRYIPELSSHNYSIRQAGERMAANTPIQGSAADLCKLAMRNIACRLDRQGLRSRMVLEMHDELVFEAPSDEVETVCALVRDEMQSVHPLAVPLVVDVGVGDNWAEAH